MSLRIFSFFQNDSYFIKVTILTVRSELGWKNAKGMTRKTVGLRAAIRALPDAPAPGPRSGSCLTRPLASGIRASVSFANRTRWTEQKGEISMLMRRWRLACLLALRPLLSFPANLGAQTRGSRYRLLSSVQWLSLARMVCVSDCGSMRRFCN